MTKWYIRVHFLSTDYTDYFCFPIRGDLRIKSRDVGYVAMERQYLANKHLLLLLAPAYPKRGAVPYRTNLYADHYLRVGLTIGHVGRCVDSVDELVLPLQTGAAKCAEIFGGDADRLRLLVILGSGVNGAILTKRECHLDDDYPDLSATRIDGDAPISGVGSEI